MRDFKISSLQSPKLAAASLALFGFSRILEEVLLRSSVVLIDRVMLSIFLGLLNYKCKCRFFVHVHLSLNDRRTIAS